MRDVLVIGAGPAGCVAASHLVNQGYKVTIVEKAKFPRFVIGESLLPVSMEQFEEVGLLKSLEKAKFEVKSGALFLRGKEEEIDISFAEGYTPGWSWTWQVPRDEFDNILAQETEKKGVEFFYESEVTNIDFKNDSAKASIKNKNVTFEQNFKFVIDSSGNAGVLAKMLSLKIEYAATQRKSIFTHVKDVRAADFDRSKRISFDILAKDLWFWVIPFSNGVTSLGFVGGQQWFSGAEDSNELFKLMLIKTDRFFKRFEGLEFLFDVKEVDDYTCYSEQLFGDRYVLTGNTTGFIDPVFSSGVALATTSALKAAKLVDSELKGEEVDWQVAYADYVGWAGKIFRSIVDGWYEGSLQEIFFYPRIQQKIKEQLTSVLAGYVWDKTNPFVRKHEKLIYTVAKVIELEKKAVSNKEE